MTSRLPQFICVASFLVFESLACIPNTTGAPCSSDANCPTNQHCVAGKCEAGGSGGTAGGMAGGAGGSAGGTAGGMGGGAGGGGPGVLDCNLPMMLDWTTVAKNTNTSLSVTLNNPTASDITASVGNAYSLSGDHGAFSQTDAVGVVTIAAGTSQRATITFSPLTSKTYEAAVQIRVASTCPAKTISLVGIAVDAVLTWSPSPLDFGYVPPLFEEFREVTFTNLSAKAVEVSNFGGTGEFRVTGPASFTVLATGAVKVNVGFKPSGFELYQGQLRLTTNLPEQPTGALAVRGIGGGPNIEVTPTGTLSFGQVAYSAGASPAWFQARSVLVKNIGTRPMPADVNANLRLGKLSNGRPGQMPYFELSPLNATTAASEFVVTVHPSYLDRVGLETAAVARLLVVFTPSSVGMKSIELTIHSNDLATPTKKLIITADAVVLPSCRFTVSPTTLNAGLISTGTTRDLAVSLLNTGTGPCQFSNISIGPSSDPAFQLAGGPIPQVTVPPGESTLVNVRVAPTGAAMTVATPISGNLQFNVSSATMPQAVVPLSASLGPTCLALIPTGFNFGTVKKGCNSASFIFKIYNTCSTPVTVTSSQMTLEAGEPAGGPNCPGTSPCPEFIAVDTIGIAPNTQLAAVAAPTTFSVKYLPINEGPDTGTFTLKVTENGLPATYIFPLTGRGDALGQNVESTTVGLAKADVLLVIDNSCSMGDRQLNLAMGFQSFVSQSGNVDYQIAVTTTDMVVAAGRIQPADGGMTPKLITPFTPNAAEVFAAKVKVGVDGDIVEQILSPAVAAVTEPRVSSDNLGLIRTDASLAIVSVSDADDQSPQPAIFYISQLVGLKPPGKISFSSIGPYLPIPPVGCVYDGTGGGVRTLAAVNQLGGIRREICSMNWNLDLEAISAVAFGGRNDVFVLKSLPDMTGGKLVGVKVNGVNIPPVTTSGTKVWNYEAMNNSVNFTAFYVPQPDQTVTLTYFAACL